MRERMYVLYAAELEDALGSAWDVDAGDPDGEWLGTACNLCVGWVTSTYYTFNFPEYKAPGCLLESGELFCIGG